MLPVVGVISLYLPHLELPTMAMAEIRAGLGERDEGHQECLLPTPTPKVDSLYKVQPIISLNQ